MVAAIKVLELTSIPFDQVCCSKVCHIKEEDILAHRGVQYVPIGMLIVVFVSYVEFFSQNPLFIKFTPVIDSNTVIYKAIFFSCQSERKHL